LHFTDAGYIGSHMLNAQAGYDYLLNPKNSIAVLASYSARLITLELRIRQWIIWRTSPLEGRLLDGWRSKPRAGRNKSVSTVLETGTFNLDVVSQCCPDV